MDSHLHYVLHCFRCICILNLLNYVSCITKCEFIEYEDLSNSSSSIIDVVQTQLNRCSFYPRCLLFACCNKSLIQSVNSYFGSYECSETHDQREIFRCMLHKLNNCSYDSNLATRFSKVWMSNETVTMEKLSAGLVRLPPTAPQILKELALGCRFKVLYLISTKLKSDVLPHLLTLGDTIFLSYHEKYPGL